jgi:Cd2+/Zn2+-exporting ATPase/Cu+-exporting ATPase
MNKIQTLQVPITGMDCAECTRHVQTAISKLPGVESVDVFLSSEKAVIRFDPNQVELPDIREAVKSAGYSVPDSTDPLSSAPIENFTRRIVTLLAVLFGVILFIIVVGEWFGLFAQLTERVPFPIGLALVIVSGWPIFRNVVRAALNRQVISHTLMTLGVLAVGSRTMGNCPGRCFLHACGRICRKLYDRKGSPGGQGFDFFDASNRPA